MNKEEREKELRAARDSMTGMLPNSLALAVPRILLVIADQLEKLLEKK